jgi:putative ABC transport system permease protein
MIKELSPWMLVATYSMLLVPLALILHFRLGLVRETLIAIVRMSVQLTLVGLYLSVLFELNSIPLNLLWFVVMLAVANSAILRQAKLSPRRFFLITFFGVSFATAGVSSLFVLAILRSPLGDARYLIPIFGMVLGNCMRSNVTSLERFYSTLRDREKEYATYLMLGATPIEASRPYFRAALRAAVAPHVSTMATMGVVSLPGMMTGQILGGSDPSTAIQYQLAIMICIFTAMMLTTSLNLLLSSRVAFDEYGVLRDDVFSKRAG